MAIAVLPTHRPLTEDDLAQLPDDGHRYELVDGELLVSPSPKFLHQRVSGNLFLLLSAAVTPGYEVSAAPYDWRVDQFNVFVPDLMVLPLQEAEARRLEESPLLAVEILSPSSRQRDLSLKLRAYEAAGLSWYLMVDPEIPSVTVMRLIEERFVEVASARGDETLRIAEPLSVELIPAELLEPHNPQQ